MATTKFHVRPAGEFPNDRELVMGAMDSCLIHLAATGNEEQWGKTPFSEKERYIEDCQKDLSISETHRKTGQGEAKRSFLAEIEDSDRTDGLPRRIDEHGKSWLSCGFIDVWENEMVDYIHKDKNLKDHYEAARATGPYLFIHFLVTDFRAGAKSKGAGAALIDFAKSFAVEKGMKTVYVDCWVGGTLGLVKYYENLGFQKLGDYSFARVKSGGVWHGRLFYLTIS